MSVTFDQVPILDPQAAMRLIEGEAVVVTSRDSTLHTANAVGTRILQLSDGTRTLSAIVERITEEFEVDRATAEADAVAFVDELCAKGVLALRSGSLPSAR